MNRGLIHIYHGNGKGKTTSGIGLCIRAAGANLKVLIYQFLKDNDSSERKILSNIPGITLEEGKEKIKFIFKMSQEEKNKAAIFYGEEFERISKKAEEEAFDVLFFDEILHLINYGLLEEERVITFLENKPEKLEVIMTGYEPSKRLLELGDYVSCIQKEKHPFDKGISARKGIER